MKTKVIASIGLLLWSVSLFAQAEIYRCAPYYTNKVQEEDLKNGHCRVAQNNKSAKAYECGPEYINSASEAKAKGCKLLNGPLVITENKEKKKSRQDCYMEAAKAPTENGLSIAMSVCNQRYSND